MRFYEIIDEQGRFCDLKPRTGNGLLETVCIQSYFSRRKELIKKKEIMGFDKYYCLRKEIGQLEEGCQECGGFDKKCPDYLSEEDFDSVGSL